MPEFLCEFVYLGVVTPPPDVPPHPPYVEKVFADEAKAVQWRDDQPPVTANSAYRSVQKREVER